MEKFDDRKLINLARYNWFRMSSYKRPEIDQLFSKESLSNPERNTLLTFLNESRAFNAPQMSIRSMKEEIFQLIGVKDEVSNPHPTVSRRELELIYNHLKGIKSE
jgi:hypothetical protein